MTVAGRHGDSREGMRHRMQRVEDMQRCATLGQADYWLEANEVMGALWTMRHWATLNGFAAPWSVFMRRVLCWRRHVFKAWHLQTAKNVHRLASYPL